MKILFLDDERMPNDVFWLTYPEDAEFMIARNICEFKQAACNFEFDSISFDHDLGLNEHTGYDCLKWLCDNEDRLTFFPLDIIVHSQNPIGAENIRAYWKNWVNFMEKTNDK